LCRVTAQTREARRGKENGIWLCQNCGRLIDADPQKFTVEVLSRWKLDAQARAFRELVAPGVAAPTEEAARVGSIIAADNTSTADAKVDKLFATVHAAASTDLATYKHGSMWSSTSVELTLRLYDDQGASPFSISRLPLAVELRLRSPSSRRPEQARRPRSCNWQDTYWPPILSFRYIFGWVTGQQALRVCWQACASGLPLRT
jgi:hypothetical protein